MNRPERCQSVATESAPAVRPVTTSRAIAKLELLDGDEIIQLSIKPSLWFIPVVSARVIALIAILGVLTSIAMAAGSLPASVLPFQILSGAAAARVGFATLQWASRLYVLTNRRVMAFRGVFSVGVAECRLTQIGDVSLAMPWYGYALRLGTVRMAPADRGGSCVEWLDVSRPQEVHEALLRAIRKSQRGA